MDALVQVVLVFFLFVETALSQDIFGCGGFIRSHQHIDLSKIQVTSSPCARTTTISNPKKVRENSIFVASSHLKFVPDVQNDCTLQYAQCCYK